MMLSHRTRRLRVFESTVVPAAPLVQVNNYFSNGRSGPEVARVGEALSRAPSSTRQSRSALPPVPRRKLFQAPLSQANLSRSQSVRTPGPRSVHRPYEVEEPRSPTSVDTWAGEVARNTRLPALLPPSSRSHNSRSKAPSRSSRRSSVSSDTTIRPEDSATYMGSRSSSVASRSRQGDSRHGSSRHCRSDRDSSRHGGSRRCSSRDGSSRYGSRCREECHSWGVRVDDRDSQCHLCGVELVD